MTKAQKEHIACLRIKGESYAGIARQLSISENTVKSYCRRNSIGTSPKREQSESNTHCATCRSVLCHTPGKKKKRFCSDKCRRAWWNCHMEVVTQKAIYSFVCKACGVGFSAYGNSKRKYCSRSCSAAARRMRNE